MKIKYVAVPLLLLILTACHTDPFSIKPEVPIDPDKVRPSSEETEDTAALEKGRVKGAYVQQINKG